LVFAGVVERVIDGEYADEARDIEQAGNRTIAHDEPERAAVLGCPPMRADERAEPRRIEKFELRQIDDEVPLAFFGPLHEGRAYGRRGCEIQTSAQLEDQKLAAVFGFQIDMQLVLRHRVWFFRRAPRGACSD